MTAVTNGDGFPTADVGIDLDGCLYDFVGVLGDFLSARTGRPRSEFPPAQVWEFFSEQWGLTLDQFLDAYAEGVRSGHVLWHGDPFAGVKQGWKRLRARGHRLHVITDRSPRGAAKEAYEATLYWLRTHGLEPDTVTITRDKTEILALARPGAPVAFIEDRVENYQALSAAGVKAYMMARPWNAGHPADYVADLEEFALRLDRDLSRLARTASFG